jgi:DNA topoisomerase-1
MATPAAAKPHLKDGIEDKDEEAINLPAMRKGTILNINRGIVSDHKTKASPRYTMSTLIAKLEKLGIGRPATIASILKNVQAKGTVVIRKDKKLEATAFAEKCYDILYPRFAFAHIGYTAELEAALDLIAQQKLDGVALTRNVWDQLDKDCAALLAAHQKTTPLSPATQLEAQSASTA